MATGSNIRTYFDGQWHDSDLPVFRAADHAAWLGSTVFDGARFVDGMAPDLMLHCARLNRSAEALGITPSHTPEQIHSIALEGLSAYSPDTPVYVRPMYWSIDGGHRAILNKETPTGFAISLEVMPMADPDDALRLTTTRFRRPVMEDNLCNAKAGCLYPNNARMLREALARGFHEVLVGDAIGNVAEAAVANVFMVRDGEVFTPIPNGTFLSGITRARHISNLRADGVKVTEAVLTFDDFRQADEVFLTGNLNKITPVSEFDGSIYASNAVAKHARSLYWDWAASEQARS